MAVLAIHAIGHLPTISKGNWWALTPICLHTLYVFAVPIEENSAENVMQAYFSGILVHKHRSVAFLCNNVTEFKNTAVNEACDPLELKSYSPTHSNLKVIQE